MCYLSNQYVVLHKFSQRKRNIYRERERDRRKERKKNDSIVLPLTSLISELLTLLPDVVCDCSLPLGTGRDGCVG